MDAEPIESAPAAAPIHQTAPPAPTVMDVLKARAARLESTRHPALVRETVPIAPKPEGFDSLVSAVVAMRRATLGKRPLVEPVVAAETDPPEVDAHKFLAVKPTEAAPLQYFRRTKQ
jgi:hypothetical protein